MEVTKEFVASLYNLDESLITLENGKILYDGNVDLQENNLERTDTGYRLPIAFSFVSGNVNIYTSEVLDLRGLPEVCLDLSIIGKDEIDWGEFKFEDNLTTTKLTLVNLNIARVNLIQVNSEQATFRDCKVAKLVVGDGVTGLNLIKSYVVNLLLPKTLVNFLMDFSVVERSSECKIQNLTVSDSKVDERDFTTWSVQKVLQIQNVDGFETLEGVGNLKVLVIEMCKSLKTLFGAPGKVKLCRLQECPNLQNLEYLPKADILDIDKNIPE